MDYKLSEVNTREIIPGYHGKLIHGTKLSLAFWEVEEGAEVPEHAHTHEQVMHVQEGQFQFTVGGVTRIYGPGELAVIPPEIPHSSASVI